MDFYVKIINIKYDGLGELLIKLLLSSAVTYHHLANNNLYPISNPVTWGETWEWVKLPKHAHQATQTNKKMEVMSKNGVLSFCSF